MQDTTRRPSFAQSPSNSSRVSQSFAGIDATCVWRGGLFSARPIAKLASAFAAAHPRFRLAEPCSHRDEEAVTISSNAIWVEMITRWHWKIGAHSGDHFPTLPSLCQPGKRWRRISCRKKLQRPLIGPYMSRAFYATARWAGRRMEAPGDSDSCDWQRPGGIRQSRCWLTGIVLSTKAGQTCGHRPAPGPGPSGALPAVIKHASAGSPEMETEISW